MNNVEPAKPKPIVARDQVRLGLARCWQLAVSGMSYRLFRSMVTTAILALAAAFLVHMLGYGLIENETKRVARERTQEHRRLGQDLFRLSKPDTEKVILLAFETNDTSRLREYATWAKLDAMVSDESRATATQLATAADYFVELATAPKAVIVGDRSIDELLDYLTQHANFTQFARHLKQFALRPPLDNLDAFRVLVTERRPKLMAVVGLVQAGQQQAIERVASEIGPAQRAIVEQPPDTVATKLSSVGYAFDAKRIARMREFAQRGRDQKSIEQLLVQSRVLGAVARKYSIEPKDVNFERLTAWAASESDARWLHGVLKDADAVELPDAERIHRILSEYREQRQLNRVAGDEPKSKDRSILGLPPRSQWLVVLSFLVCMVGVANAMLMSVTERFTEIATMKCLGALDRFVMSMFVLEALIQGAAGGAVGLLLGIALALVRGLFEFGSLLALASGATATVALATMVSLGATMILAALSAVGPAYVAARLSPMEAMRVE